MVETETKNLLLCYKFSEYPVIPQVKDLLESKSLTNAEFKAAVNEIPFI
jgi:hypothetical protein